MTTTMRMPMLAIASIAVILMAAANAPHRQIDPKPSTPQQEGPRAGNSECAPSGVDISDAHYACPQNRPVEQAPST